ncbi:MAG: hypothetical protein WDM88_01815 [Galbitalea sp.]
MILDRTNHRIIEGGGATHDATGALSIQQPGDPAGYVLLETATGLLRVDLGSGAKTSVPNTATLARHGDRGRAARAHGHV